ncbi:hypothetical protein ACEE21_15080 [Clostridium baratii]
MKRVFKAFNNSDKYFVEFDFDKKEARLVSSEEVAGETIEGVLIKEKIQNAWHKSSACLYENGELIFFIFVKDVNGKFHRLKFVASTTGDIDRSSLVLGTNENLMHSEFGEGLFQ